uniref:Uncharacterized protein n=1 Tax=Glossina brevipalpis TaxID=37001 RepID=A0A1A9W1W5_9MUSC
MPFHIILSVLSDEPRLRKKMCFSFLPCGLVYGYTISTFVAAGNLNTSLIAYGPMILASCSGLIVALAMFILKYLRSRIAFWHINILVAANFLHFIASFFYFAKEFDNIGSFISYLGHSITIIIGLSFLHAMADKNSRAILITLSFSFYMFGMATSVSLIANSFTKEEQSFTIVKNKNNKLPASINYVEFAGVYLAISVLNLALLIGLKILNYIGSVDYENSLDNDLRIANSNGILAMIICNSVKTSIPFWLIILCFGMNFSSLQIILVEVAHFRYNELVIYASYALKLLATSIIYYYFISNEKNSYFYSTDISTLMSQGFVFIIIVSLLALVVGMKVPRTYRTTLFEIQYRVLGIIFQKHQIEQLNLSEEAKHSENGHFNAIFYPEQYLLEVECSHNLLDERCLLIIAPDL